MAARVRLIKEKDSDSYCVLTYLNTEETNSDNSPNFRTYFLYTLEDQQIQLKKARQFGNERAESLDTKLEEKLEEDKKENT
jgi:hypothetical protein